MSPLAQIWIIAKLEIGRAFFSRRALWVYLLALFPAVIFIGHGIDAKYKRENWKKAVALAVPASIDSLSKGMTADQVLEKLGKPISKRKWDGRHRVESTDSDKVTIESVEMQSMFYFDGSRRIDLRFESGKLTRISKQELVSFEEDRKVYAAVFQYFYLRLAIFFGCLGIFINLFRGEMLDKSLHFWFLAPVRRDVLLLGKYCAGLIAASVIFGSGALISFCAMVGFQDPTQVQSYLQGDAAAHLGWYVLAAVLGCVGYGSVFLAAGLLLRNPIIPAVVVLLWESINGFLPDLLQKLSVLHYLQSICPIPAPVDDNVPPVLRMILSPAAPSSAWVAIFGLLGFTALVLFAATYAIRRLEINYGTE